MPCISTSEVHAENKFHFQPDHFKNMVGVRHYSYRQFLRIQKHSNDQANLMYALLPT